MNIWDGGWVGGQPQAIRDPVAKGLEGDVFHLLVTEVDMLSVCCCCVCAAIVVEAERTGMEWMWHWVQTISTLSPPSPHRPFLHLHRSFRVSLERKSHRKQRRTHADTYADALSTGPERKWHLHLQLTSSTSATSKRVVNRPSTGERSFSTPERLELSSPRAHPHYVNSRGAE